MANITFILSTFHSINTSTFRTIDFRVKKLLVSFLVVTT